MSATTVALRAFGALAALDSTDRTAIVDRAATTDSSFSNVTHCSTTPRGAPSATHAAARSSPAISFCCPFPS